jgi:hypothetical protein
MAWKIEERGLAWAVVAPDGAETAYNVKAAAEAHLAIAAKGMSFDAIRQRLQRWVEENISSPKGRNGEALAYVWVHDVFTDNFIYSDGDKHFRRSYAIADDALTVGEPVEVRQDWEEVKSAGDTLVYDGGAVKALGNGRVGGYLITFGDATTPDISAERDYFTTKTDYGGEDGAPPEVSVVLYQHGQDDALKTRKIGRGTLKADEVGVWIEAQLNMRDEYEKAVYGLAEKKKLGWSSGTAPHLVERKAIVRDGKTVAHEVLSWPLGLDASLTPNPAEPRNHATSLKSLVVPPLAELAEEADIQISKEPPAFQGTFDEEAKAVASACNSFAQRVDRRLAGRTDRKAGRELSARNIEALQEACEEAETSASRLRALLEKARPKQDTEPEAKAETERLLTEHLRLTTHRSVSV